VLFTERRDIVQGDMEYCVLKEKRNKWVDIQCCVLKQGKNRAFVMYSVVYWKRGRNEICYYTVLCTERREIYSRL